MLKDGIIIGERYEIVSRVGSGGMADVYKAMDHKLNRMVAVKILKAEFRQDTTFIAKFRKEAQSAAGLTHANIVNVYDVGEDRGLYYIVMELVDGVTLLQYMEKRGALPWNEALHFARQIAKALSHAHSRGIIHRDIKPHNVMLLRDGTIKVADFGIAALEHEYHEISGEAVGSIHYIAPEQARGEFPDPRSDIYSLGVVMYEMFTGRKPYLGDTIQEIAVKHMNADPPSMLALNPTLPPELERITLKAMCADRSNRYQTANELVEDIDGFLYDRESVSPEGNIHVDHVETDPEDRAAVRRQQFFLRWNASKVSWLAGSFILLLVSTGLLYFLWNFWIRDLFNPAVRVTLPDFQGQNYDSVSMNPDYLSTYSFHVLYMVDTEHAPGTILSQSPNPGRSIMMTPGGVEVNLSVATGDTVATVPDVSNLDYRTATAMLRQVGLYIEVVNAYAETVDRDRVIRTEPSAGMEVNTTSLIYVYVSCGTEKRMLTVPNLIGLSEEAAISQIESNGFSYGWSQREHSDLMAGTVVGQSLSAFSTEEEHSMIYLTVSDGPVVQP